MRWRNTRKGYGWVAITLHWLVALVVFGLFGLGLWMVELTYYDPWYRQAPAIHKAVGVLLFLAVVGRLVWRWINPSPALPGSRIERIAARLVHGALYALLLAVMVAGYLISTADGSAIDVFGLFSMPATVADLPDQEDVAGVVHFWLAWTVIVLTGLHAAAALKHQFIDRDGTLMRMLRPGDIDSPTRKGE
ncbi:cytochrome b [Guyparkeria sp.]|uniref:cytochrome b n=1 Tax=Guyparkeria sp. TaxID=2035736 RepID=UPI003970A851